MTANDLLIYVASASPVWVPLVVTEIKLLFNRLGPAQRLIVEKVVATAVAATEQIYKGQPGTNDDKKKQAEQFISDELSHLHISVNPSTLNALLEAAVGSLPPTGPTVVGVTPPDGLKS